MDETLWFEALECDEGAKRADRDHTRAVDGADLGHRRVAPITPRWPTVAATAGEAAAAAAAAATEAAAAAAAEAAAAAAAAEAAAGKFNNSLNINIKMYAIPIITINP